jgi:hypothetical protein
MSNNGFWGCQTVQEFFANNNWDGLQIESEEATGDIPELKEKSWLTLTVESFFSYNPWEGNLQEVFVGEAKKAHPLILAIPVKEFFASIPWQGGVGRIAALPKPQSKTELSKSSTQELKLNDLSQLF